MKPDTFNDFDKQIYITFTNKCNWKCEYCDFPSKIDKSYDLKSALRTLRIIPSNIEVYLEGGELGVMPEHELDLIFDSGIADTYAITTNGEFLKRGYHEKYKDRIHYILYHVAPEIFGNTEVIEYDVDESIRVDYTFVLHEGNMMHVDGILTRYPHLDFLIHLLQPRTEKMLVNEDPNFYKEVLAIVEDKDNIGEYFKTRLDTIIANIGDDVFMARKRKSCANIYNQISINLPDNTIHRCCVSTESDQVLLTRESLAMVIRNQPTFPLHDSVCHTCIANFVWDGNKVKKALRFII
jgi:hypothetical protein